jgi:hypothetical protein
MTYSIPYSDPTKPAIAVSTATVDASTSIYLVGKNYIGYGELIATNFLHLLENFANTSAPPNPIEGQIWYDTSDVSSKKLKVNTGLSNIWENVGLKSRNSLEIITGSSSPSATVELTVSGFKSYSLHSIQTNFPARIRLYITDEARQSDKSRNQSTQPEQNIGLVSEVVTTSESLTKILCPSVVGMNNDTPINSNIYMLITNNDSSARVIEVTMTILQLEQ